MTQDKKQIGYSKFILAMDCETTGICKGDDPSIGQQCVSWGIVVADTDTLKPVKELYVEIKWNEASKAARKKDPTFGEYAATKVHGLSYEYLEEHGISEEEAVMEIVNIILEYWGPNVQVKTLGHNVVSFDLPFMRAMFRRHGIEVPFGSRHYDTNAIGWATVGSYTSDALFTTMGYDTRNNHNALEDTLLALNSCRRINIIWRDVVGLTVDGD